MPSLEEKEALEFARGMLEKMRWLLESERECPPGQEELVAIMVRTAMKDNSPGARQAVDILKAAFHMDPKERAAARQRVLENAYGK